MNSRPTMSSAEELRRLIPRILLLLAIIVLCFVRQQAPTLVESGGDAFAAESPMSATRSR